MYPKGYAIFMKKLILFLFLFLFNGCSVNNLMTWIKLDRVEQVSHNAYMTHYRAYFQRDELRTIRHGKKYLFFYNKKKGDLAILLRDKQHYKLYSITHPSPLNTYLPSDRKHGYYATIKALKKRGYRLASPSTYGFTYSVQAQRYKGVRTYRVDVKDYRKLISLYKKAIRNYNAKYVRHIRTKLPSHFIRSYYNRYKAKANSAKKRAQLRIIAQKLGWVKPERKEAKRKQPSEQETKQTSEAQNELQEVDTPQETPQKPETKEPRTNPKKTQTASLKKKEESLLENGSLEELITAYKQNGSPEYKAKILARIKELQHKK